MMAAFLEALGWWLLWATAVPFSVCVVCFRVFRPKIRRYCRDPGAGREMVTVHAVRLHPPGALLPGDRKELDS